MKIAHCYIEHRASAIDQTYSYEFFDESVSVGKRVIVEFGSQRVVGFVVRISEEQTCELLLKPILEVLDEEAVLSEKGIELGLWMAKTTIAPTIACFQAMLPKKLKPKSKSGSIKMMKWVRWVEDRSDLTVKQSEALAWLKKRNEVKRSEWLSLYKSVAKRLEEMGLAEIVEKEVVVEREQLQPQPFEYELNHDQLKAIHSILHPNKPIICLHGVTGSGKTEVFLHCASEVLKQGKQVLILVPEISLTPLMVNRVKRRFGDDVAIYHSALNDQEKYEQYQSLRHGQKKIVVGTRSAVFMPFWNLGLIIIDEEHDTSYKQDSLPRYHCRDVAIQVAKMHQATLVLASATPSLETYARAVKGNYQLVSMPSRIAPAMPQVELVNMNEAVRRGESYMVSNHLLEAMEDCFSREEQVILLLNRRGYQPTLRCSSCNEVIKCPHCDRALVYHKDDQLLKCHLCGYAMPLPRLCPSCQKPALKGSGFGTQRLEEFIQEHFPSRKIIRMDADTTARKNAHQELLDRFEAHQADILLGTQMIAKGLDFENVTLVGILQGDALLYRSDYRCSEMTFDLLCQASGRSGRGSKSGKVILQVFDDQHYSIQTALHHDYQSFFLKEMQYRHLAQYPPYTYLANLLFIHADEKASMMLAHQIKEELEFLGFKVLGPSSLLKVKDQYRYRLCIKSKDLEKLQKVVYEIFQKYRKHKVALSIDMNPLTMD